MIGKHHNYEFDAVAPGGVPEAVGDRYLGQDLFRDFLYTLDRAGHILKDCIHHIPFHVFGGAVWQGTGATLNITAGYGYAKYSVQTVLSYAATPPTTQNEDIEAIRIAWASQTDLALPSYTPGGAVNYVKVAYAEAAGSSRARAKKAGTYTYDQAPSYVFSVDVTPPTDYEICLATFTEAAGTFTISPYYYPYLEPTHRAGHIYPHRNVISSNWDEQSNATNIDIHGIAWSPYLSLFCAVGKDAGGDAYIITSPDAVTWTERAPAVAKAIDLFSVCWSPTLTLFCAVGQADGADSYILTSPDGITWTERAPTVVKNIDLNSVCWSEDLTLFCAVGNNDGGDSYILTSPDGITWTERVAPSVEDMESICWSPELTLFCAVGATDGVDTSIYTSPDGVTWTERVAPSSVAARAVCWSPELTLFCAVGNIFGSNTYTITSPDGINWTLRVSNPSNIAYGIMWSPDLSLFCMTNASGYLATSEDGVNWEVKNSSKTFILYDVVWSPYTRRICAVGAADGADGYLITSLYI